MAHGTDKENSVLSTGMLSAISYTPYALFFGRAMLHASCHREVGSTVSLTVRPNPESVPNVSSTAEAS
ncbi:MAG: hypothetical protein RL042_147 [Nitrospirota bacterium]